ncbi:MAG: hypothetical protein GY941_14055 [Planctomycetes bacterium]|nr:hypothetical protein [Planctomycetota bacterium]
MYADKPSVIHIDSPVQKIPHALKRGELYIKVDLSRNKKEIQNDFEYLLNRMFSGHIQYKKRKNKAFVKERHNEHYSLEKDKFEIYDMHHQDVLNFSEIARQISGYEGNVNSDPRLNAVYKSVKRAYENAKSMIEQEDQDMEERENVRLRGVP